jgi:hypothetical protein
MNLKFQIKFVDSKLSLYWNDNLLYTGTDQTKEIILPAVSGWNELIIECERLNSHKNFGDFTIESFQINDTNTWPIDAGDTKILMPFSLCHGYCYTENGKSYLAYNEKLFTNSYQRIYFRIEDSRIVDYYHDRNPQDDFYNNFVFSHFNIDYQFWWSDIYQKYIHRHMMTDHFMAVIDPVDKTTYGVKWNGVKFEYTESALAEDLQRIESDSLFPFGSTLYQSEHGLGFRKWLIPHVFGSFLYKSIPPDLVAPLLVRV